MGLEILLTVLGVILFVGLFLSLRFSFPDIGARVKTNAAGEASAADGARGVHGDVQAPTDGGAVLYIVRRPRREAREAPGVAESQPVSTLREEDDRAANGG